MINSIDKPTLLLTIVIGFVLPGVVVADTAVTINYGIVTASGTVEEKARVLCDL